MKSLPEIGKRVIVSLEGVTAISDEAFGKIQGKDIFVLAYKDGKVVIGPKDRSFGVVIAKEHLEAY